GTVENGLACSSALGGDSGKSQRLLDTRDESETGTEPPKRRKHDDHRLFQRLTCGPHGRGHAAADSAHGKRAARAEILDCRARELHGSEYRNLSQRVAIRSSQ